jgi:hypothetical protein
LPDEKVITTEAPPPSLGERIDRLSPEARAQWQLTGEIPTDIKSSDAAPAETAESSPAPASEPEGTEGAPGTPAQEPDKQQPKPVSNRELRRVLRDRDREIERLQAEFDRFRSERDAERQRSAPPAEEKHETVPNGRPKRPRMKDFEGPDAIDKYEAAMEAYEIARDEWHDRRIDERQTETRQGERIQDGWTSQQEQGRAKYKDFDQVAFSPDVPASFSSIPRLKARKDGGEIAYFLGKHKEIATRIAELTHVPGIDTPAKYQDFLRRSMTDPRVAALRARAEALADAEFDRIAQELGKPAAEPKPSSPKPKPTAEVRVNARGSPVDDELSRAISTGDFVLYQKLANERDASRRR